MINKYDLLSVGGELTKKSNCKGDKHPWMM